MAIAGEEKVQLHALSERQRQIVESHLPLVGHTMKRHGRSVLGGGDGRDAAEFFQEGCLALMEAVRSHDPSRHGAFATFAMARIRYAMSRYAHEECGLIRVPFSTQRRHRQRRSAEEVDRHRPDTVPRIVPMDGGCAGSPPMASVCRYAQGLVRRREDETLGDLLRARCDSAMREVVKRMKAAARDDGARFFDVCYEERWSVPEPEARTPFRRLATALGCSLGRLTRAESLFHELLIETLGRDNAYRRLVTMARHYADGLSHVPTAEERATLGCEVC